jgi:hypothetical protein
VLSISPAYIQRRYQAHRTQYHTVYELTTAVLYGCKCSSFFFSCWHTSTCCKNPTIDFLGDVSTLEQILTSFSSLNVISVSLDRNPWQHVLIINLRLKQSYELRWFLNWKCHVFSCNVPTTCTYNEWYYSHFILTCYSMTTPSSGSKHHA